ncbi:uncharacterized protein LOC121429750 isoform X2 [Lytechinus variegatus]|uniref:uncharacterized protein LOC121429750 isoform X2 n=1 Tax=Lytechinus variegatus TaxID=7654 RepID=UPI001BB1C798|nr:uncharacterized protein LOC121429750 isoform X2 [Lytechinus variegatus]
MVKRKHQPAVHQQEQCDVWLSTAQKKEQTPAAKRQRVFRPMTNIADVVLSSQPIKVGTKQTDIKNFFAPKSGQENVAPKASSSSQSIAKQTKSSKNKRTEPPLHRAGGPSGSHRSHKGEENKSPSAISRIHSSNYLNSNETNLIPRADKSGTNEMTLLHDTQDTDTSSSQELDTDELCHISHGSHRVSSEDEETEDITFTMGTQGCLKVKEPKTRGHINYTALGKHECSKTVVEHSDHVDLVSTKALQDSDSDITFTMGTQGCLKVKEPKTRGHVNYTALDTQECSKTVVEHSDHVDLVSTKALEDSDSSHSMKDANFSCSNGFQRYQDVPKCEFGHGDLEEWEGSDNITFTMGSQGCLKVKQSRTKRHIGHDINITQDCFTAAMTNSELSPNLLDDTPNSLYSKSIPKTLTVAENTSSLLTEFRNIVTKDLKPAMDTQVCLEWIQSKQEIGIGRDDTLDSEDQKSQRLDITPSEDLAFTMGSQGCLKVRDRIGRRSNTSPPQNSMPDTDLTVGSEGHLGVGDSQNSDIIPSEDSSQEVEFTVDSQGCQKVRGHRNERSVYSMPSENLSEDVHVGFKVGSQSCPNVRNENRSYILSEDSSEDVAFTSSSKGQQVKGKKDQGSDILSDDLSQELALTVGSQGCLKVRASKVHLSNTTGSEDSEDISLSMVSQGSRKDMGSKGHRSIISSEESQEEVNFTMGSQGCLRVRESKSHIHRPIIANDSSKDMVFTMTSQGQKVIDNKGHTCRSYISTDDSSEDSAFTMGSQDIKVTKGHLLDMSPDDSSEEVAFTMDSQGCLKVRDCKGHRSKIVTSPKQLLLNDSLQHVTREGGDDEDESEDDEFSQTQDW